MVEEESGVFPTNGNLPDLPPSYDDVMRLPNSYPKVSPQPKAQLLVPVYNQSIMAAENNGNETNPAIIEVTNIEESTQTERNNNNYRVNSSEGEIVRNNEDGTTTHRRIINEERTTI